MALDEELTRCKEKKTGEQSHNMSTLRKKCFPKLSRLRKDLWSWHSDIESLMQGLDAPKKNTLVKDENPEDKMNAKCFEMIHKLCRMSALSPDEIVQFLKDADGTKLISRFASSGQLSTGRLSYSPEKPTSRGRTRSSSPDKRKHSPKSNMKDQRKHSPIDRNSRKIIKDLEEQIVDLEKENDQLIDDVEKLDKEVQWYKNDRDYWIQYGKENERSGKQLTHTTHGTAEYDQLRKQYEHLQNVYENICLVLKKDNHHGHQQLQHDQQLQLDAARYRAERNNARLQVQEIKDKMIWYKGELDNIRTGTRYSEKKPGRRYNTSLVQ